MTLLKKILDKNYDWGDERIGEDAYEELFADIIIDYLKHQSPRSRQLLAMSWNFDNPPKVIKWIAEQPDTDRGTALMLYWMMEPGYCKQFANRDECALQQRWYVEEYDILQTIERNYTEGFYKEEKYAFDPRHDAHSGGCDRTEELKAYKLKGNIPQEMFVPTSGICLEAPDWADGVPPELEETMDRLAKLTDE